jgi:hypothetical protein
VHSILGGLLLRGELVELAEHDMAAEHCRAGSAPKVPQPGAGGAQRRRLDLIWLNSAMGGRGV